MNKQHIIVQKQTKKTNKTKEAKKENNGHTRN